MTTALTKRLARAVLIAGLALPAMTLLPANAPFAITKAHAAGPTTVAEFKSVLAAYGKWGTHDKYGDIWVPTVTPQGWHPYPACQWAYTKEGWYFNDNTPWGSIVHHYGRWSHDAQIGWFWVPDQDWSPGWVVWRQSDQWVGWAPMPPQQDVQLVSTAEFNNDKLWTFMAADKFRNGGCGHTVIQGSPALYSQAFYQTRPVTWFGLYPGLLVDIDIDQHWTINNIIKIIKIDIDIDIDIDINYCPQKPVPVPGRVPSPIHFNDPGPKDRKASNDPTPTPTPTTPNTPIRSINPTIPLGDPGKIGRVSDPNPLKPVLDVPLRPIGKVGRVDGGDNGGKTGRGDGGSGSGFKGPHISLLPSTFGHTLTPASTGPLRTPVATGPRVNSMGAGLKGGLNAIR
jgi:hypothetical protein